ncbi:MAG: TSUP family transporter [Maricaulaceae bacterium]
MKIGVIILIAAFGTAFISGVFGMAGGLIFMGVIATFMGVAEAMVVHGLVQSVSNSSRAYMLREHIRWDILGYELIGALPAGLFFLSISFLPSKGLLFLALGLLPLLLWLPRDWVHGDIERPRDAIACGALVMGLNLSAGVAGPALDFFYVKTELNKNEIVATKALTMFASHMCKVAYFGVPLIAAMGMSTLPPIWVLAAALPCAVIGTYFGTRVLQRFSDAGFRNYSRWLVTAVGAVYIWRAAVLLGWI